MPDAPTANCRMGEDTASGLGANRSMDIQFIRSFLKSRLTDDRVERLKRFQALRFRRTQHFVTRILFGRNLRALSVINHSDKWGYHFYAKHYERHFRRFRKGPVSCWRLGSVVTMIQGLEEGPAYVADFFSEGGDRRDRYL